jgi:hypothetical protein
MHMDADIHWSPRVRLLSRQLPLPLELSPIRPPVPSRPASVVVLPQQVWTSLPVTAQAQMQRAFIHIFREVVGDARQR